MHYNNQLFPGFPGFPLLAFCAFYYCTFSPCFPAFRFSAGGDG